MLTVNYALIALTVIIFTVLNQLRIRLTLCFEVRTYSIRFNSGFTWFVYYYNSSIKKSSKALEQNYTIFFFLTRNRLVNEFTGLIRGPRLGLGLDVYIGIYNVL